MEINDKIKNSHPDLPIANAALGEKIYKNYEQVCKNKKRSFFSLKKSFIFKTAISAIMGVTILIASVTIYKNSVTGSNNPLIQNLAESPYGGSQGPQLRYHLDDLVEFYPNLEAFEISFNIDEEKDYYLVAYCSKELAKDIYERYDVVMDATPASPISYVDGTIVNWLKQEGKLNRLKWKEYTYSKDIPSRFHDYIAVGVYLITNVTILNNSITSEEINRDLAYYKSIHFENNNEKFLTRVSQSKSAHYLIVVLKGEIERAKVFNDIIVQGSYSKIENNVIEIWYGHLGNLLDTHNEYSTVLIREETGYYYFNYLLFLETTREIISRKN